MKRKSTKTQNALRYIGGVKFAVIVLSVFALALVLGTFLESFHGTEYAARAIYKHPLFLFLQFLMFVSILISTLQRLPYKKKLFGFYMLHMGLLILLTGAVMTYFSGIDGNITLFPLETNRKIELNDYNLVITYEKRDKTATYPLPYTAKKTPLNTSYENIKLVEFLPFSETKTRWMEPTSDSDEQVTSSKAYNHSSTYQLKNAFTKQKLTLSLHPEAIDFPLSQNLGPLKIHYLPSIFYSCFQSLAKNQVKEKSYFLWNREKDTCRVFKESELQFKKDLRGHSYFTSVDVKENVRFYPDHSPWPMDENLQIAKAPYRLFNPQLFISSKQLFLFGKVGCAYFDDDLWETQNFESTLPATVILPWMNMELTLLKHRDKAYPYYSPEYIKPHQKDGQVLKGKSKAVKIQVQDKFYWITTEMPLALKINDEKVSFRIENKSIFLPFELTLTRFKMNTNPGTQTAASYESFVDLKSSKNVDNHHVFMNHPLKYDRFTFYQASYFPYQDKFGSVLSVNFDPGRPIKYFGCFLLVLGTVLHFCFFTKLNFSARDEL